jgi:hypothetical protein
MASSHTLPRAEDADFAQGALISYQTINAHAA